MKTPMILLALGLPFSLVSSSGDAGELLFEVRFLGDIDGDQRVSIEDAVAVQELLDGEGTEPPRLAYYDTNGDNHLTPLDVLQILNWATGAELHPNPAYEAVLTLDTPAVRDRIVLGWSQGDFNADGLVLWGPSRAGLAALELDPIASSTRASRLDDGQPLVELSVDPSVFEDARAAEARVRIGLTHEVTARVVALQSPDGSIDHVLGIWINQGEIPAWVPVGRVGLD